MKAIALILLLLAIGCGVDDSDDTNEPDHLSTIDLGTEPDVSIPDPEKECDRGHWLCIDRWTLQTCPNDWTFWETDCQEECGPTGRCVYDSGVKHDTCSCFGP